jgi:Ca2+:H+ antiporter
METRMSLWSWLVPLGALAVMVVAGAVPGVGTVLAILCTVALIGAVVAAVHHAEVVARRVGEPFGTLLLSVSVTVIEVALIVSVMMAAGPETAVLARDTIFSVIMITCNGLVGASLLIGALRHGEQSFHVIGSNAILATLATLTTLSLVLPSFTSSSDGPTYTNAQLTFAAIVSLVLWGTAVFVQTIRHRDYFLPVGAVDDDSHGPAPPKREAMVSFVMLLLALVAVVGIAHAISPVLEAFLVAAGAPKAVMSIAIATLTLAPEAAAALRDALRDRLQSSLNLAMGSALASIGLTIPAVALCSRFVGVPLVLGLAPKELVLIILTFGVASITLVAGRTHMLQGVVHLVILGAFLFFSLVP